MKLSTRTQYGLRAMIIISQSPNGIATSEKIAIHENISKKYLDSILGELRKAEILSTVRGVKGGYTIVKGPENTTVFDIFSVLENSDSVTECVNNPDRCERGCFCPGRSVWTKLAAAMRDVLSSYSIADLAKEEIDNKMKLNIQ
ncbi:MAG: RrF2 family transcriptional regulator [Lentisphaeria bacterium]